MNRRMLLVTGTVLVFGAVLAVAAVAQNIGGGASEGRECTPEMMENMSSESMAKTCTPEMMQNMSSGNMTKACTPEMMGSMMGNKTENHMASSNHCGGSMMGGSKGSMMGEGKGSMM